MDHTVYNLGNFKRHHIHVRNHHIQWQGSTIKDKACTGNKDKMMYTSSSTWAYTINRTTVGPEYIRQIFEMRV